VDSDPIRKMSLLEFGNSADSEGRGHPCTRSVQRRGRSYCKVSAYEVKRPSSRLAPNVGEHEPRKVCLRLPQQAIHRESCVIAQLD